MIEFAATGPHEHPQFGTYLTMSIDAEATQARLRLRAGAREYAAEHAVTGFNPDGIVVLSVRRTPEGFVLPGTWWSDPLSRERFEDLTPTLRAFVSDGGELPESGFDLPIETVTRRYRDGEEHGWDTEFAYVAEHFPDDLRDLRDRMEAEGQREPVLLGSDRRVWDGHKRLTAATALGWRTIKVAFS